MTTLIRETGKYINLSKADSLAGHIIYIYIYIYICKKKRANQQYTLDYLSNSSFKYFIFCSKLTVRLAWWKVNNSLYSIFRLILFLFFMRMISLISEEVKLESCTCFFFYFGVYALKMWCLLIIFTMLLQITFCLLFALVIAFVSDGLSTMPDKASVLSSNTSFRLEFRELVRWKIIAFFVLLFINI